MSKSAFYKSKRIASLTFKVTRAKEDYEEARKFAQLLQVASTAITAVTLFAYANRFVRRKLRGGFFSVERLEFLVSEELAEELEEELRPIYEKYGDQILTLAKILCPIRTGRLMRSLTKKTTKNGVVLKSDCPYYWVQEAKFHFVKSAVEFYEPIMMAEIDALIASKQTEVITI